MRGEIEADMHSACDATWREGGRCGLARRLLLGVTALMLAVAATGDVAQPARDQAAAEQDAHWPNHGRTSDEQRYSPLDQINARTVSGLGLAWYADLPTERGVEATPIEVDGVIYNTLPFNVTTAYDARTGRILWTYDPEISPQTGRLACCDIVSRGVAVSNGKVFIGALDGRLIALDARTGTPIWSVQTTDTDWPYTITGAPRVVEGKVLIGNAGAELGVRGYISAYDAETGKLAWRFHAVPGNPADGFENDAMAQAAKTWTGEWWKSGGGGTIWDAIAYDPELRLVYFGTGNGSPWVRKFRSPGGGDNLFLSSIVAVRADTGEYVWHYQETPGEQWDYTATQPIILTDLKIGGRMRKVLLHAPKNGFFYVLDRVNGKLISAKNYVPVNWATGIDMRTGRPIENPAARYGEVPVMVSPGAGGAHNWYPMAFSPKTRLVYFPVVESYMGFAAAKSYDPDAPRRGNGMSFAGYEAERKQIAQYADEHLKAWLTAWDPVGQREVWRVPYPRSGSGGVLATAGNLVFQGTIGQTLAAYRADTGQKMWEMPVQNVPISAPISYMLDGIQYIAVNAGWGGGLAHVESFRYQDLKVSKARLLVFRLGGTARLPTLVAQGDQEVAPPPPLTASADIVRHGGELYGKNCSMCHGNEARGGIKDLRHMTPETHADFMKIVLHGSKADKGMASFADMLSQTDAEAIHHYLIARANADWQENKTSQ